MAEFRLVTDDKRAYQYDCPVCFSPKGEKCTEATETGRKSVNYIHWKRQELVEAS